MALRHWNQLSWRLGGEAERQAQTDAAALIRDEAGELIRKRAAKSAVRPNADLAALGEIDTSRRSRGLQAGGDAPR